MKIIVIGGVAGGASAAARIRRLDANAEIIILEKGSHVSFSNCSLPYYLGGLIEESQALILMDPDKFYRQHRIDARVNSEAIRIDSEHRIVYIKETISGKEYTESYDKLILSPGASPAMPKSIPGIQKSHVFSVRNVEDICHLKEAVHRENVQNITVVGSGFVGLEIAENLQKIGKHVTLVESAPQILRPFDYDIVQVLHKELYDHGIQLCLNSTVTAIEEGYVRIRHQEEDLTIKSDIVVMAIGVIPETQLAKETGLELGKTGAIKVNTCYQTSDPHIYAVGDAIEIYHKLKNQEARLNLAGPAQKQARIAADHIYGRTHLEKGYIGSSCIQLFTQNAACTGLNERDAKEAGYHCDSVLVIPPDKVSIMPNSHYLMLKLVFEIHTGKLLGAQAVGKGAADKRIDVIASMITMDGTVDDLKELELCYSPIFGTARDVVNQAALAASNILEGRVHQVHVEKVRNLVENHACIIDVREKEEYAAGHLKGAVNIPLSCLRDRMDEIPKDVPVYLHCRTSQRSYYAICHLAQHGYHNIWNISGSFLGISLFEYFNDKILNREPIVTNYNFH